MGFLDYFFSPKNKSSEHSIQFGRFSDSYKEEKKYDAWDQSLELFEQGSYLESYERFFYYLSDESVGNVELVKKDGSIEFTFYQGSKTIHGFVSPKKVYAEAKIAKTTSLHIGFLRKLLEDNYHLKYCRYALDGEQNITVIFDSYAIDGSPYKLYYALKELSTQADKRDDVLIEEFDMLEVINNSHIRTINESEKRVKYNYIQDEIRSTLSSIDNPSLNISLYPGAESYLYLDLLYRLDYLIKPEGPIMEIIDQAHHLYFDNKVLTPEKKNKELRKLINLIKEFSYEDTCKEIYEVKSTFGITQASGQNRVQEFILSEIKNMDWYYQNHHDAIAQAIPSYIVGYSLYNYSIPAPLRAFFNLYYQVVQPEFFKSLGISTSDKTAPDKSFVRKSIKSILTQHDKDYIGLEVDFKSLQYENLLLFSKSYLIMLSQIKFIRKDHR